MFNNNDISLIRSLLIPIILLFLLLNLNAIAFIIYVEKSKIYQLILKINHYYLSSYSHFFSSIFISQSPNLKTMLTTLPNYSFFLFSHLKTSTLPICSKNLLYDTVNQLIFFFVLTFDKHFVPIQLHQEFLSSFVLIFLIVSWLMKMSRLDLVVFYAMVVVVTICYDFGWKIVCYYC